MDIKKIHFEFCELLYIRSISQILSQWAWWHTWNPNYQGARGRRVTSRRSTRTKLMKPHLKNKIQAKGQRMWLRWQSTCLAYTRPWVQSQRLQIIAEESSDFGVF
jgi:hypothetical protein